jgi:class 3 adenylate cyclase
MSGSDPRAETPLVNWSELGVSELLPSGTVTLLLADVEGSTRLWETQPDVMTAVVAPLVLHRHVKNRRLAAVGAISALASLRSSPGARRHYDARRAARDWNHQAQRHLFNKLLGQLHHCLQTGQLYNEHRAFTPPLAA